MGRHKKQKQSNFIWWIIFIVFCILIYLIWKDNGKFFKKETTTTELTQTTIISKKINFETKTIKEESDKYIINISYPYFNINFVDNNIQSFVNNTINNFKGDARVSEVFSSKNTLDVLFDHYLISQDLISLRFIDAIYTGGAHGNQQINTKNFNLKTKKEILLKDLFKNDSYLAFISQKAIQKLLLDDISDKNWINEGASPKYSNFENFTYNANNNGLIFHFSPYQVAPYSEGIVTFELPINSLTGFMK
jgi:hypothetical protein